MPVTQAGVWPLSLPNSSISQAIVWALVPMSGAGMSRFGPTSLEILSISARAIPSSSCSLSPRVSTLTPPFAPPNGMPATAVFQVIIEARARTSSTSTSGWKRMPPL